MDKRRWVRISTENSRGMVMKKLIDSCILIDHFNGVSAATSYLKKHKNDACISIITKAEVLIGFEDETTFHQAQQVLSYFHLIELDQTIIDLVIQLRREQIRKKLNKLPHQKSLQWKLPDAIQAAIALHYNLKLVTHNTKDFDLTQHPFVEVPYTV
jgi:predicted nucleic acid-binding protein